MSLLFAQSFDELTSRARFFEYAGYFLGALAFAILAAGVVWSIGKRYQGRSRLVFVATSWGVLAFLVFVVAAVLVMTSPSSPAVVTHATPVAVPPQPVPESPPTGTLVLQVDPDGKIAFEGRTITRDEFPEFLEEAKTEWTQQGIALENVTVEFHCDQQLPMGKLVAWYDAFQQAGIARFAMRPDGDDG